MSNDIEAFQADFESRKGELVNHLAPHITYESFKASMITAVQKNPDLLLVDRHSLFLAVCACAADGLIPDGRRAVIMAANEAVYKRNAKGWIEKDAKGSFIVERWIKVARYQPMIEGIRERAFALDNIIMSANVVYEGDEFTEVQGSDPKIIHNPMPLSANRQNKRGEIIGAYAVFTKFNPDTGAKYVLHFEVLDMGDIAKIRSKSTAGDKGFLWKDWFGEACKKSAVHRGKKSVPVSPRLQAMINRWEDHFDKNVSFDAVSEVRTAQSSMPPLKSRAALPPPDPQGDTLPMTRSEKAELLDMASARPQEAPQPRKAAPPIKSPPKGKPAPAPSPAGDKQEKGFDPREVLRTIQRRLAKHETREALDADWEEIKKPIGGKKYSDAFRAAADKAYLDAVLALIAKTLSSAKNADELVSLWDPFLDLVNDPDLPDFKKSALKIYQTAMKALPQKDAA